MFEKGLRHAIKLYEDKMRELMPEKDFQEFMTYVAKDTFRITIEGMRDSEFKTFCLENFDYITGGDDDEVRLNGGN